MKKIKKAVLAFAAMMLMTGTMPAIGETMSLGYCNLSDYPTGDLGDSTPDVTTSAAIYIPASTAATIGGCSITGVQFGINLLLNVESATVWIRNSLDGKNLVEKTIDSKSSPKLTRSWNKVSFDEAWAVPADCEGFYMGYTVMQKGYAYAIANSPAASRNGLYVNLAEGGWKDLSGSGTLYLRGIVEGDNLPAVNLGIASCTADDWYYTGKKLTGKMGVYNTGVADAASYKLNVLAGGKTVATKEITEPLVAGGATEIDFEFSPDFGATGNVDVTFNLSDIASGQDVDPSDNDLVRSLQVMASAPERMILVEEFSTEMCPNCPSAATILHSLIERYEDRIAAVVHHSGYYTDPFTTNFDPEYEWFYNGGTFAPAFMVDRLSYGGGAPTMERGALESFATERMTVDPVLGLSITATVSESDPTRLSVVVKGEKYTNGEVCAEPYVTIWLTEDNVLSVNQRGATGFVHQHVGRLVNSTWGTPISFDGNNFEYHYEFTGIKSTWKGDDLAVVAAVHNKRGSMRTSMEVANACMVKAADFVHPTAVAEVAVEEEASEAEYYTLSGYRVDSSNLVPGLYIRCAGNKVEKIIIK